MDLPGSQKMALMIAVRTVAQSTLIAEDRDESMWDSSGFGVFAGERMGVGCSYSVS